MKNYKIVAALIGSFVLGAGGVQMLHAQTKPAVYAIAMVNVKDQDGSASALRPHLRCESSEPRRMTARAAAGRRLPLASIRLAASPACAPSNTAAGRDSDAHGGSVRWRNRANIPAACTAPAPDKRAARDTAARSIASASCAAGNATPARPVFVAWSSPG